MGAVYTQLSLKEWHRSEDWRHAKNSVQKMARLAHSGLGYDKSFLHFWNVSRSRRPARLARRVMSSNRTGGRYFS